ncbi:MAG: mechanosensitive ion channel protein [Flavobacterium sp. BFFFF2]|nr:MAG: mechanosensitive ion channel protein [Flavobacterium sp. BFFFF2]
MKRATDLSLFTLDSYWDDFVKLLLSYSPKVVSALIILIIGIYAIRFTNRMVKKIMLRRDFDPTLSKFLADSLIWSLRVLLFITFISKLGIETSSFVAILGAAGLAVGLSLQGSLANLAGGVLIILFKPFRVNDTIEAQGVVGQVIEIQIFVTKLLTASNQTVFIPNGGLSNGTIINYSLEGKRRADLNIVLAYSADLHLAKQRLMAVMNEHPAVLQDPAPSLVVQDLSETGIHVVLRPWALNADFGKVSSEVLEQSKTALDLAEILLQSGKK